jgi:hypothetical protein
MPSARLLLVLAVLSAPVSAQTPFALDRLAPGQHAFELRLGDRAVGTLTATLRLVGTELAFTETTSLPGRTEQTTELRMSATGEMISVRQTGATPGGATSIDVKYGAGRAKGSAITPAQGGQLQTIAIDTTVPRFAIDDNALQPLLPALRVSANGTTVVQVFSSGRGVTTDMTIAALGEERVTVPAGTFDTWKLEVRGTPTVHFYVTKAAPYILVKMAVQNSPLEMVRLR